MIVYITRDHIIINTWLLLFT